MFARAAERSWRALCGAQQVSCRARMSSACYLHCFGHKTCGGRRCSSARECIKLVSKPVCNCMTGLVLQQRQLSLSCQLLLTLLLWVCHSASIQISFNASVNKQPSVPYCTSCVPAVYSMLLSTSFACCQHALTLWFCCCICCCCLQETSRWHLVLSSWAREVQRRPRQQRASCAASW